VVANGALARAAGIERGSQCTSGELAPKVMHEQATGRRQWVAVVSGWVRRGPAGFARQDAASGAGGLGKKAGELTRGARRERGCR
jgi:hypothetical protein